MLAVALTWPGAGRRAAVSLPGGSVSQRLQFLTEWADAPLAAGSDFAAADGFAVVDTAKKSRCNVEKPLADSWSNGRPVVNIDHHASNTQFGDLNWVEADASSASEMVYRLIRSAGRPVTPVIASLLYAGIHSDTVGFSLPTATSSALRAAADLVDCGARVNEIGEFLGRSQSQSEFELQRLLYANTRVVAEGRVAYSTASYDQLVRTGCSSADIDEQVAIPRSLRGIDVAVLFTEGFRGKVRLNLRGESSVDVLPVALQLGGGGHAQSAGAILDGSIEDAVGRVLPMIVAHLDGRTPPRART